VDGLVFACRDLLISERGIETGNVIFGIHAPTENLTTIRPLQLTIGAQNGRDMGSTSTRLEGKEYALH
jgi:hypothetical protein